MSDETLVTMSTDNVCLFVGFRLQDAQSVNLLVNCAVNEGLCDQMCERGDPEAGTLDHCTCRPGFMLDSSARKCLGQFRSDLFISRVLQSL